MYSLREEPEGSGSLGEASAFAVFGAACGLAPAGRENGVAVPLRSGAFSMRAKASLRSRVISVDSA
jgi:hypothetical protein